MVANALRGARKGVFDWTIQRITAGIILAYLILLLVYLPQVSGYIAFKKLFIYQWMKVVTLMTLGAILWHAWIGIWTIFTDYVKCACMRISLQVLVLLALIGYFIWGVDILWSV